MPDYSVRAEEIKGYGQNYRDYGDELTTKIAAIEEAMTELVNAVHGPESPTSCWNQWENAKSAMTPYKEKLYEVGDKLIETGNNNISYDQQQANKQIVDVEPA